MKLCRCRLCGHCFTLWHCLKNRLSCLVVLKTGPAKRCMAIYAITFMFVLPLISFNLKYSAFFLRYDDNAQKKILIEENSERLAAAQQYFEMLDRTKLHGTLHEVGNRHDPSALRIALSVITVSRNRHKVDEYEPNYLTQVIWKFLYLLHTNQAEGFSHKVLLSICNVDHDPATYAEAAKVSRFVPMFQRFNNTHFSMVHPLEKEKQDYVFCLNQSLVENPDYVLLVEDDALPSSDFFQVLDYTLSMHLDRRFLRGEFHPQYESIAYVKFYHPDRLLGFWGLERERIPELISFAALLSMILIVIYLSVRRSDGNKSHFVVYVCIFIYSLLLVAAIGRPNFTQMRSAFSPYLYSFTPAPSCCTPAMLFPQDGAKQVISYLDKITCDSSFGKDSGLDRFLAEKKMKAYLVQPNTFTHIGLYSSLRERIVDPFIV